MKKYYTYNLGCRVNNYELQIVEEFLISLDYEKGNKNDHDLDIIVLNTCSVTATSDQKSRKMINHFRKLNPNAKILVMGCFVENNQKHDFSNCDLAVGTNKRSEVMKAIATYDFSYKYDYKNSEVYEEYGFNTNQQRQIPEIKIEDGCNAFCSFCKVCHIRGRVRSRKKENVLDEIGKLIENNKDTFILVGINLGEYGLELDKYKLVNLVDDILKVYPEIKLSFGSLELSTISDDLIDFVKTHPQMSHHFHIPLQSGSTSVLKRMNRNFNKEEYLSRLAYIQEVIPDATFSTDIIVGFPGESEEDFLDTVDVAKQIKFRHMHIFPYSKRSGTPAATFPDQVDESIKKERFNRLNVLNPIK